MIRLWTSGLLGLLLAATIDVCPPALHSARADGDESVSNSKAVLSAILHDWHRPMRKCSIDIRWSAIDPMALRFVQPNLGNDARQVRGDALPSAYIDPENRNAAAFCDEDDAFDLNLRTADDDKSVDLISFTRPIFDKNFQKAIVIVWFVRGTATAGYREILRKMKEDGFVPSHDTHAQVLLLVRQGPNGDQWGVSKVLTTIFV